MAGLGPYATFSGGGAVRRPKRPSARKPSAASSGETPGYTPPAPPAPSAPPPPWQPLVDAQVMGIYANRDTDLAGLDQAQKYLQLDYGLVQQPDGSFAVDVNNPQGKAALLQRTYQQARRGDLNGMAAQGHLYSGAYQRQVGERNRSEQLDFSTLSRNYAQSLGEIGAQRTALTSGAAAAEAAARLQAAMSIGGDAQNTAPATSPGAAAPKAGFKFVQSSGSRAGMSYNLVKRPDGQWVRVYENGDRILRA
jgi:hypothetical protein